MKESISYRIVAVLALGTVSCLPRESACNRCGTVVISAIGSPDALLPPLVGETVGSDIGDLVFEPLAWLDTRRSPLDSGAYRPALAARWEHVDPVTWRFHLRPDARWQDGTPVTANDVVFSFAAYQDSVLDAVARGSLEGLRVTAEDDSTVGILFPAPRPDQLYDATYHVRIFPKHLWDLVPPAEWGTRREPSRLIGSGAYRVVEWDPEHLTLQAVGADLPFQRVVWRFAADPDAALNLVLSGEADVLESVPNAERLAEVARDSTLDLYPYPAAIYGFLGFNLGRRGPWERVEVRRALVRSVDRAAIAEAVFGTGTVVPPGPLSRLLWLWEDSVASPPRDTAEAGRLLDGAGWRRGRDGVRRRVGGNGVLTVDILVPSTSTTRRSLAVAIQEAWRQLGVRATVTAVDFPVFQERLAGGRFDTFIGAWRDEPNPRSLADQWTRAGWGRLNYMHYADPVFDSLLARVMAEPDPVAARAAWRSALRRLEEEAPAMGLYTLANTAVVRRGIHPNGFPPFAWLRDLPAWEERRR